MKTKFFKRLSFVLVVAMVLSLFVPAAGAFAAAAPKLNSTNKYLHFGVDKLEEYNFNISNKQKGWKYDWKSANEDVAVVNKKNGVTTATGVGKTKISVDITLLDGDTLTLSATVTVRDNIKEVTIKNPVDTLGVGEEYNYNRDFVTVSGSTKKTGAITRWEVDSDKATIDDKGVFVASEAGEYTVTARSYQSKARYNSWLKDADEYADYVLATDETTVVVGGAMVEAKQVDLKTVDVVFDSAMEDVKDNIAVYQLVGNTKVNQIIEKVEMKEEDTVARVTLYVPFATGATYTVEYTDMDPVSFDAATTKVEDVVAIQITTSTAVLNDATEIGFKLLNADGVNITTQDLKNRVRMTSSGGVGTFFNTTNNKVTIFTENATTTITATFHTYKYDNTGKETVIETAGLVIGVKADAQNIVGLNAWTIVDDNDPKFDDVKQVIAVGDNGYKLFVEFNTKTGSKEDKTDNKKEAGKFDFVSSDKNVLIVDSFGNLYPVKDGQVTVVISYGDAGSRTVIGALPVTVSPKRAAGTFTLSATDISLSNAALVDDKAEVEVKVKDQYGNDFSYGTYSIKKLDGSVSKIDNPILTTQTKGKIAVTGKGMAVGTYYYRVTVADMIGVITVNILDGSGSVESHRLQLSETSVDVKAEAGKIAKDITIELFGYNSKGVKVRKETIDNTNYVLSIKAPKDDWNYNVDSTTGKAVEYAASKYTLASGVSPSAIVKAPVGTYEVTAKVLKAGNLVPVDVQYFTVTDSQAVPVVSEVKSRLFTDAVSGNALNLAGDVESTDVNLIKAVKETLKFTVDGNEITTIHSVKANGTVNEFNVISVTIRQSIDGAYVESKVSVGLTISKK